MSVSVLNTDAGLEGKTITNLEDAQTVTGLKTFDRDPNPPFAVSANSDVVENLVAESVEGGTVDATTGDFSGNVTVGGTLGVTGIITGRDVTTITNTDTGAQNNWNPTGKVTGNTIIFWTGASSMALTGIAGGSDGDTITIFNNGTGQVTFEHGSSSSNAGNRFFNNATSAPTPISTRGWATYYYDGSINFWVLLGHEQGAWITPTFAAGDYTASAGTWTVDSGDVIECEYRLTGKTLNWTFFVNTTDVSTTPLTLKRIIPGGFTAAQACHLLTRVGDAGGSAVVGIAVITAGVATVDFYPTVTASTAWTATSGDNTFIIFSVVFEVT